MLRKKTFRAASGQMEGIDEPPMNADKPLMAGKAGHPES
jgi:hypothetical protein